MAQAVQISIIMPFYNNEDTIKRTIKSVQNQSFADWEFLAVDDGSSDKSADIIKLLAAHDKRIKLIKHDVNMGASQARNTGIENARGSHIALIDSDDVWRPYKLEKQLSFMQEHPEYDVTTTCYRFLGKSSHRVANLHGEITFETLLRGCNLSPGSTLLTKIDVFKDRNKAGLFDTNLKRLEDWDWFLRASQNCRIYMMKRVLADIHYTGMPNSDIHQQSAHAVYNKNRSWIENKYGRSKASILRAHCYVECVWVAYRQNHFFKVFLFLIKAHIINPSVSTTFINKAIPKILSAFQKLLAQA